MFAVVKPFAGHETGFEEGDIILTLDNELITNAKSIFRNDLQEKVNALVLRSSNLVNLHISTFPTLEIEASRVVIFCGATLQQPHLALRQDMSNLPSEVYLISGFLGSPVDHFKILPLCFITHINNERTPNLDTFIEQAKKVESDKCFLIKGVNKQNIPFVKSLMLDEHYFPLVEYQMGCGVWKCIKH
jgi:pro-apoptotic serine protease NMA111